MTTYTARGIIGAMDGTVLIAIKWPADVARELRIIAANRHTTVSELVRQAAIEHYSLTADDTNQAKSGTNATRGGSN